MAAGTSWQLALSALGSNATQRGAMATISRAGHPKSSK
jgi:hypothetical protein